VIIEYTILMIHKAYIPASVITPGMPRASVEEFEKEILALQIVVAELRRKNEVMVDMLSDLTGQLKEQLRADLANDKYMCPAEAVKYGLADMVRARKPRPLPVKPRATEPAGDATDDVTVVEAPALMVRGTPAAPAAS
jgi:ATP-dependent protease ClpP protease subunit